MARSTMDFTGTTRWFQNTGELRHHEETDPDLYRTLDALGDVAVRYARSIAPVGRPVDGDEHPGTYRDSITHDRNPDGPGVMFYTTDEKASWIEYGLANVLPYRVLARAVDKIR